MNADEEPERKVGGVWVHWAQQRIAALEADNDRLRVALDQALNEREEYERTLAHAARLEAENEDLRNNAWKHSPWTPSSD